jgi:ribonuclease BN (tRNA processing enzyme)
VGDEHLLFDVGRGVAVQMARAGIPMGSLRHVFITHHHFDHIGDLYDVACRPGSRAGARRSPSTARPTPSAWSMR